MEYTDRLSFQETLGYHFNHVDLLTEALTHSVNSEKFPGKTRNYERLKFMGECVLKLVISEYVIRTSDVSENEGKLTQKQVNLIKNARLKEIGKNILHPNELNLLRLASLKNPLQLNYCNFLKALFGAVFIDSGGNNATCLQLFCKHWESYLTPTNLKTLHECFQVPDKIIQLWQTREVLNSPEVNELQTRLQYQFKNKEFLQQAITHKSFYQVKLENDSCIKNVRLPDYQRLEFLGDAVLDLVVAQFYYANSNLAGTALANKKSAEIGKTKQAQIGKKINLIVYRIKNLQWKRGHDIVESIIGGMYVDGGIGPVREFIICTWGLQRCSDLNPESDLEKLQSKLNYRFVDETLLIAARTHPCGLDDPVMKETFKRLKLKGEQSIRLIATEYVIRHYPIHIKTSTINVVTNNLCSEATRREIAININLKDSVIAKNLITFKRYELFIWALVGAVLEDSKDMQIVVQLFYRLWNKFLVPVRPLEDSFPSCNDNQLKLRTQYAPECYINESDFVAIEELLCYKFRNRNLIEQAMTSYECKSFFSGELGDCDKLFFIGFRALKLQCSHAEMGLFILANYTSTLFSKHFVLPPDKKIENKAYLHAFVCVCLIGAVYVDSNDLHQFSTTIKNFVAKSRSADCQQSIADEICLLLSYKMDKGRHDPELFKLENDATTESKFVEETAKVAVVKPMVSSTVTLEVQTNIAVPSGTVPMTPESQSSLEKQLEGDAAEEIQKQLLKNPKRITEEYNRQEQNDLKRQRKIKKKRKLLEWLKHHRQMQKRQREKKRQQKIKQERERQKQVEQQRQIQEELEPQKQLEHKRKIHQEQLRQDLLERQQKLQKELELIQEQIDHDVKIQKECVQERLELKSKINDAIELGIAHFKIQLERTLDELQQEQLKRQQKIIEDRERQYQLERQQNIQEERTRQEQLDREGARRALAIVIFFFAYLYFYFI